MKDPQFIQELITRCHKAREEAAVLCEGLSLQQLNWKPDPDSWSIGQCLEHLVVSNCLYFPVFKKITDGTHEMNWWENWSPLSSLFGNMLVSQVGEKVKKKLNAPNVFLPPEQMVDAGIRERFHKHLDSLVEYMAISQRVDIDKTHITSPVSRVVTYSLRKAFLILVQHLHRHIRQAKALKTLKGFPEE